MPKQYNVYSRHTLDVPGDNLFLEWARLLPAIHLNAITSLRFTHLDPSDEEYGSIWDVVSSLPNLKKLFVMIHSLEIKKFLGAGTAAKDCHAH
jgi:hypothetical protein